jgi:O-antigen ligase
MPPAVTEVREERSFGLLWLLWSIATSLPWILPTRTPPWATFYAEAFMAACLLIAGLSIWWAGQESRQRGRLVADAPTLALFALAAVPLFQGAGGLLVFRGESILPCLYLLALAMTHFIARSAWNANGTAFIERLWVGLVIAALISTGLAIYQWLGLDGLDWLVSGIRVTGRAEANLGQPNNLATLLCWGLAGMWWAFARHKIGGATAVVSAAFLLVGVALTQSRASWLMLAVFPVVLALGKTALGGSRRHWAAMIGLALWFLLVWVSLTLLAQSLAVGAARGLNDQLSTGTRPMTWQLALDAIASRPWAGFGWNQFLVARVEFISQYPQHPEIFSYAHNLLLDLLAWNGVVIGGLAALGLAWWWWQQVCAARTVEQWVLLAALSMLTIHAMLEMPHAYIYFLLPAAVMAGTLSAMRPSPAVVSVPRWCAGLALCIMAAALAVLITDYRQIEARDQSRRIQEAGIASRGAPAVEQPLRLLGFISEADAQLRQQASKGMQPEELARWRATLTRFPVASSLARFAQAAALNGQLEDARWALTAVCGLYEPQICEAAAQEWAGFILMHPEAAAVPAPTSPRRK